MPSEAKTRSAPIGIRLFPEVKTALEAAAKADRRSVASYVETLIVMSLREKGFLAADAGE